MRESDISGNCYSLKKDCLQYPNGPTYMLEREGIVTKARDPDDKQKVIYSLSQRGIDLLPVMVEIGRGA